MTKENNQSLEKLDLPQANPELQHRQIVRTFRSKFNRNRRWYDRFADFMTEQFGTVGFFAFNLIWFLGWVVWNNIPGLPQFDPYPHNFLTMVVSLEAIFLSIIVLISQNRQSLIADMREEIDFNVNVRAEEEITKILNLLDKIHDHLGLENENDAELNEMKQRTDLEEMETEISREYLKKN
jgi:uncharacterized membrane protein